MSAKSIMIQGTMSNTGKSFITAGLCRVFKQDGYKSAPFKSQNMALNSYITEDGLEIGRAQAMQAEAAGIVPSVTMNPILLKPTSNVGSQVIVLGEILGNMKAADYFKYKTKLIPKIMESYDSLAKEYDIIVIEGAGSPAEINLKENDIVNMGMAKLAEAPVLLVGDIDRGGVFASLYGTIELLLQEEKERIQGMIINKFRGDVSLLKPGLTMIEEKVGIPVLGVIPMEFIDIDDEDSLSDRLSVKNGRGGIDIAVIRFPRISNFTDFAPLERIPEVSLRYVEHPAELCNPDLIVLPGTKSTMEDLRWLRESGLETLILRQAERKTPIMGICGGYQMLSFLLEDPEGVESGGSMRGMGLLRTRTVFGKEKTRTRMTGQIVNGHGILEGLLGKTVSGYEIHMGQTTLLSDSEGECDVPVISLSGGRIDGYGSKDGYLFGTYLHGIFEEKEFLEGVIHFCMERKGLDWSSSILDQVSYKEQQYDKLADLIRNSVDMKKIYQILGINRE